MTITPEMARQERARERARRREAERNCARRFLTEPDHECVCTLSPHPGPDTWDFDPTCSRDYDPRPYAGCEPTPPEWYEDGLGALYGLPLRPDQVADLAGWNVVRRSDNG